MTQLDAATRQVLARQVLNVKAQCDAILDTLGVVVVQEPGKPATAVAPAVTVGPPPRPGKTYFGAKPEETAANGKEDHKGR